MGVEILPSTDEQEERIRSARSIFEFDARTIDGELVSLEKYRWECVTLCWVSCDCHLTPYRGHVTLIVNVASQ